MAVNIAMKILLHLRFFSSIKAIHKQSETYRVLIAQRLYIFPNIDNEFFTKLNILGNRELGIGHWLLIRHGITKRE